jgi:hypothetical protein
MDEGAYTLHAVVKSKVDRYEIDIPVVFK